MQPRRHPLRRRLWLECLETRTNPTNINWDGGAGTLNWNDQLNWVGDQLPGASDDVVIASATGTVQYAGGPTTIASLNTVQNLTLSSGSLNVTGNLTANNITLATYNSGTSFVAGGTTDVNFTQMFAESDSTISLTSVTSYYILYATILRATGAGSEINMPALTSLNGNGYGLTVEALSGGHISMAQVGSVINGHIQFKSEGTGSLIDMPALSSMLLANGYGSLYIRDNGTFTAPLLTQTNKFGWNIDSTATTPLSQMTQISDGGLDLPSGTYNLPNLTNFIGSNLYVSGGAKVTMPAVSAYFAGNFTSTTLKATGTGSEINMPALTSLHGNGYGLTVQALDGGDISMAQLGSVINGHIQFKSENTGSLIDVPALSSMLLANGYGSLYIRDNGTFTAPLLTQTNKFSWYIDSTATTPLSQMTQISDGGLDLPGGTYNLPNLTDFIGSSLNVHGGAKVTMPAVSTYFAGNFTSTVLRATGTGSEINMPALTSLHGNGYGLTVEALNGGHISMPQLGSVINGHIQFKSENTGSLIDMSALTSMLLTNGYGSLYIRDNGTFTAPLLTQTNKFAWYIDSTATTPLSQMTQISDGGLDLPGGTYNLPNLTDFIGSSLNVHGGAKVTMPAVSTYFAGNFTSTVLRATGTGSEINMPALTSLHGNGYGLTVEALNGGHISMPQLGSVIIGHILIKSENTGSLIDMPALSSMLLTNGGATIRAQDNGMINLSTAGTLPVAYVTMVNYAPGIVMNGLQLGIGSTLEGDTLSGGITGTGTIRPYGSSYGPLLVHGDVNFSSVLEIGGNGTAQYSHDELQVNGTVTLNSPTLSLNLTFTPNLGDVVTVIANDGGDAVTGTFAGLPEGSVAAIAPNGCFWLISYNGGDGNDVTLRASPIFLQVSDGGIQRSMVKSVIAKFNEPMSLGAGAFTLSAVDRNNVPITGITVHASLAGGGKSATVTFSGTPIINGSLPDGKYTITANGAAITVVSTGLLIDGDANATPGGNASLNFHRQYGDVDGNRNTDLIDFSIFRGAFNGASETFDYDGDNNTSLLDFAEFRDRFNLTMI